MRIEQAELRDAARSLLDDMGAEVAPAAAWAAIREAGWPALTAPEAAGGLAQSLSAACWLYLELGRALSPAPLLPSLLAADVLAACPEGALRDAWLGRIAEGEGLAVSLLDPAAADLARADGRLSGRILGMQGVEGAAAALVVAAAPALVAIVPLDAPGVALEPHATWDPSRRLAELALDGVAIADDARLAEGAAAEAAVRAAAVHLHFAIAADAVGAADRLLAETVSYLQDRRQFDRPLAMFQALKHRCADLKTALLAADALLAGHLERLESGDGDALGLARAAKAIASGTFRWIAEEAVQLHGGMGMTSEHPCHLFLKRALLDEQLASPNDACDVAVAEGLTAANG